jgi:hypothetical protein
MNVMSTSRSGPWNGSRNQGRPQGSELTQDLFPAMRTSGFASFRETKEVHHVAPG